MLVRRLLRQPCAFLPAEAKFKQSSLVFFSSTLQTCPTFSRRPSTKLFQALNHTTTDSELKSFRSALVVKMKQLLNAEKHQEVIRVFDELHEQQIRPGRHVLLLAFRAYVKMKQTEKAEDLIINSRNYGVLPHVSLYEELLKKYVTDKENKETFDMAKIEDLFDLMRKDNVAFAPEIYYNLLRIYGASAKGKRIANEMKFLGLFPERVFEELIKNHLRAGNHLAALKTLRETRKDFPMDIFIYHMMFDAAVEANDKELLNQLMEEFKESKLVPNKVTFSILMKFMKSAEAAQKMFDSFSQTGQSVDGPLYATLIQSYLDSKNFAVVKQKLLEMESKSVEITPSLACIVLSASAKDGQKELFQHMVMLMEKLRLPPNEKLIFALIDGYLSFKMPAEALKVYQIAQDEKIQLDPAVCCGVIRMFGELKEYEAAEKVFCSSVQVFTPTTFMYNAILKVYVSHPKFQQKAIDLFEVMKEKQVKPDIATYTLLCKSYIYTNQQNRIPQLISACEAQGLSVDKDFFSILIGTAVAAKKIDAVILLYSHMISKGYGVDQETDRIMNKIRTERNIPNNCWWNRGAFTTRPAKFK